MPSVATADPRIEAAVEAARSLRREQGWDPEEPLPCALRMAEEHLGLDVVVTRLPRPVSGAYLPQDDRGLIFVNGTHAVVRQRFTVAHEVGHHVLGHGAAPRVLTRAAAETAPQPSEEPTTATSPTADGRPTTGDPAADDGLAAATTIRRTTDRPAPTTADVTDRPASATPHATDRSGPAAHAPDAEADADDRTARQEAQANAFAAELLAPAVAVRSFVRRHASAGPDGRPVIGFDLVVRLSCAYGISAQSVLTRLRTVGMLTDDGLRAALAARVTAGEHVPRYAELALVALSDALEDIHRMGVLPRLPEGTDGRLLYALLDPATTIADGRAAAGIAQLRRMLGLVPDIP
ncbi:MAG: ImmA/IrrE family metallo-endopeptidase [Solirubrobacteraceae bacterium]|nr:ImmA/IrrE family metallo-endopeptidase [Solirubrobacteraceae bacterium]